MFTIAKNQCLKFRRHNHKFDQISYDDAIGYEYAFDEKKDTFYIEELIEILDPYEYQLIVLKYKGDMTLEQVKGMMRLSRRDIRSIHNSALKKIKEFYLEKYGQ